MDKYDIVIMCLCPNCS